MKALEKIIPLITRKYKNIAHRFLVELNLDWIAEVENGKYSEEKCELKTVEQTYI